MGPAPFELGMRRRPPPIPDFDLANGINFPGLLSLRWGREANKVEKRREGNERSM
jgi:hypothetical protein